MVSKRILFLTMCIFILLVCHSTFAACDDASNGSFNNQSPYQTSVGYWNDNFILMELFGKNINQGEDDYVTASFWFQIAREYSKQFWIIDVYHNILTNKSKDYRTDLLSFRLSLEKETSLGVFQAGSGIMTSGDFRGNDLQNAYHRIFGIDRMNLHYPEKRHMGLITFFRYKHLIWDKDRVVINGFTALSNRTSVGPSNVRVGFELNIIDKQFLASGIFHLQSRIGYVNYYRSRKYLTPLFDKGFIWDVLFSIGRVEASNISLWITSNQYGKDQPHFGISYTFGWNGKRMCDIHDITFP